MFQNIQQGAAMFAIVARDKSVSLIDDDTCHAY